MIGTWVWFIIAQFSKIAVYYLLINALYIAYTHYIQRNTHIICCALQRTQDYMQRALRTQVICFAAYSTRRLYPALHNYSVKRDDAQPSDYTYPLYTHTHHYLRQRD